ncbi:transcriptional regulator domain-containing protein [Mesorhizobium tamadayense]|uniref:transcriptional regulator domain-containing protein n=1 Tax=Mesorhizobium tamadayense TaxID=425306 RepID=UPI003CCB629C
MTNARLPMGAREGPAVWPEWHGQDAYDYSDRLPYTALAWEFLRRNPHSSVTTPKWRRPLTLSKTR